MPTSYPAKALKPNYFHQELNKFNDFEDSFNGLGISVHDISAQKIFSFKVSKLRYRMECNNSCCSTGPLRS
ncbi:DUF3289 family protein [Escherichia coli]